MNWIGWACAKTPSSSSGVIHGWKLGEHNGWCKQTNFEVDTRSPLILAAPAMKTTGRTTRSLVEFVDIYPTLCELAGLKIPRTLKAEA